MSTQGLPPGCEPPSAAVQEMMAQLEAEAAKEATTPQGQQLVSLEQTLVNVPPKLTGHEASGTVERSKAKLKMQMAAQAQKAKSLMARDAATAAVAGKFFGNPAA